MEECALAPGFQRQGELVREEKVDDRLGEGCFSD